MTGLYFSMDDMKAKLNRPSMEIRGEIWNQTLERIAKSPFFGEGVSTRTVFVVSRGSTWNHPHNVYLSTALFGGFTGLALLLALLGVGFREAILVFLRERDSTHVTLLLFVVICMSSGNYRVTSHPDAIWLYFWLPMAILGAREISCRELGRQNPKPLQVQ
jgi:O-antigen ligase